MSLLRISPRIFGLSLVWLVSMIFYAPGAIAQTTIQVESGFGTSCNPNCSNGLVQITGGITKGRNLFHSFEKFGILEDQEVRFLVLTGTTIDNLLVRVIGRDYSEINGTLSIRNRFGSIVNTNLFLINPHGIFFGPTAELKLGGSFTASTADALLFGDRGSFSARQPQPPSNLLTVNPSALAFSSAMIAPIQSSASIELIRSGQNLSLIGGNLNIKDGQLTSQNGNINLISLGKLHSDNLMINLPINGQSISQYLDVNQGGTIKISGGVLTFAQDTRMAGDIIISANNIELLSGGEIATMTASTGSGGNIILQAEQLRLSGVNPSDGTPSVLLANTSGPGKGGRIQVAVNGLSLDDGAQINAGSSGSGQGGKIDIQARQSILIGGSPLSAPSGIAVESTGLGDAGELELRTPWLRLQQGGQISGTTTGIGRGGHLKIQAQTAEFLGAEFSDLDPDRSIPSGVFIKSLGTGPGGTLDLIGQSLSLQGGAQISGSSEGNGPGGQIRIRMSDRIEVEGSASPNLGSGILAFAKATGASGTIDLQTGNLRVNRGAVIGTPSVEAGRGDSNGVTIEAQRSIQVAGGRISVGSSRSGQTGVLRLKTPALVVEQGGVISGRTLGSAVGGLLDLQVGDLTIRDSGSQISVSSTGSTQSGAIRVRSDRIRLDNQGQILAETASGKGGNIDLAAREFLLLRHGSQISSNAGNEQNGGDGGNIDIQSPYIIAIPEENSDIRANAYRGTGGKIKIRADALIGIQQRPRPTSLSDITASSEFGQQGLVAISKPDLDPSRGLSQLPSDPVAPQPIQGCQMASVTQKNAKAELFISGRGGLPPRPNDPLSSSDILDDLRIPLIVASAGQDLSVPDRLSSEPQYALPVIEATNWTMDSEGKVTLVANTSKPNSFSHCSLQNN
jgi:filamentous hemagglutinin family protein